jgi:sortase A
VHRFLTIVSTALITAGVIVLLDVGVTLAWEEPVTSLYTRIQQGRAGGELEDLKHSFLQNPSLPDVQDPDSARDARKLADRFAEDLEEGEPIGRVVIPTIGVDAVVLQGTDEATLQKGPGHYPRTGLPGQRTTMGIAGHRTTYLAPFHDINNVEGRDDVILQMPYGDFTYEVQKTEIVEPTQTEIVRAVGYERVVLTACHPLYSAAQRYAVFGRLSDIDLAQAQ